MTTLILNLEIECRLQIFNFTKRLSTMVPYDGFWPWDLYRKVNFGDVVIASLREFPSRYWMHDLRFLTELSSLVYRRLVLTGATVWRTSGVCFSVSSFHFECDGLSVPPVPFKRFRTPLLVSRSVEMV